MGRGQNADDILYGDEPLPDTRDQISMRQEALRLQSPSAITFTDAEIAEMRLKSVAETLDRLAPGHDCGQEELAKMISDALETMNLPEMTLDAEQLTDEEYDRQYDLQIEHWNRYNKSWQRRIEAALPTQLIAALPEGFSAEDYSDWLAHHLFDHAQSIQALAVHVLSDAAAIRRELVAVAGLDWASAHDLINPVVLDGCEVKIEAAKYPHPEEAFGRLEAERTDRIANLIVQSRERKFLDQLPEEEQQQLLSLVKGLFNGVYVSESKYIDTMIAEIDAPEDPVTRELVLDLKRSNATNDHQKQINTTIQQALAACKAKGQSQTSIDVMEKMVIELDKAADADILYEYLEAARSDFCSPIPR